jgi:hypothetical protein
MSSSSSSIQVQLSLQEVSVLLALLDVLADEKLSPEVVRLAAESQEILRVRAEAAKAEAGEI